MQALVLGAVGLVTVGLLIGLPSIERTEATARPASQGSTELPVVASPPSVAAHEAWQVSKAPAPQPTPRPARLPVAGPTVAMTTIAPPTSAPKAAAVAETTETSYDGAPAETSSFVPFVEPRTEPAALVTLTGCLESDDERFRLNDTDGSEAPKSRSWKTGFLKKRPAPIALVDARGVGLPNHIGQRVALTGTLVDRNMQVRSLQRVAASCG